MRVRNIKLRIMKNKIITILIGIVMGAIGGYATSILLQDDSADAKKAAYYANSVATLQSPHGLRKALANGSAADKFVIVDVRSAEEYETEHMVTALSIPAYTNKDNTEHTSEDRVIEEFKKLRDLDENAGKTILIYCYSASCMTGRNVGNLLAKNGVYVKELTIGWNEWRYFPNTWNYPHEWEDVKIMDYVSSGTEPGTVPAGLAPKGCTLDGSLGC